MKSLKTIFQKKTRNRGIKKLRVVYCHICGEVASRHSYYGAQVSDNDDDDIDDNDDDCRPVPHAEHSSEEQ